MKKAIGYVRVSTEGQATEGVSLEAQEARIKAWAAAQGVELVAVFVDAGLSGSRADNRPELQKAIAAACSSKAVLVFYSLSRLARSTKDCIAIADRLERSGADLVSLSEALDTSSACGKMVFRMLAVLAEFERDLVAERTAAALAHKKAQGERVGNVAYGFRLEADRVVQDKAEQGVIAKARALKAEGASLRAICATFKAEGILNRAGKSAWSPSKVHALLN